MTTLGYIGERLDLLIKQGATFGPYTVTLQNAAGAGVDTTNMTAKAQIRKTPESTAVAAEMVIAYDPTTSSFSYSLPKEVTAAMKAGKTTKDDDSLYFWDMDLTWPDGSVTSLYYGEVRVFREVTRG